MAIASVRQINLEVPYIDSIIGMHDTCCSTHL